MLLCISLVIVIQAFVAFSALSLSFYGYFYCVCLLHIVIDNDILQRVLGSVTKNGECIICSIQLYVLVIPQYEYNILVITQVQGEAEDAGDN